MEHTFTSENFENEVLKSSEPVMVDFWAPWCGPCKMLGPIVEELAGEADDVKIGKLNIDDHGDIAQQYGIMSVPTLLFFKDGKVMDQIVGVQPKENLKQALEKLK